MEQKFLVQNGVTMKDNGLISKGEIKEDESNLFIQLMHV